MRPWAVAFPLAILLAGCAGSPAASDEPVADFSELELDASATTGVIRGVVVDEAVRPVAGALVSLRIDGAEPRDAETSDQGLFGYDGLAPGTYFFQVTRAGYASAQGNAEVVAGVTEPPIVKVLLAADPTSRPFYEAYTWDGYIECSVRTPAIGIAACEGYGNDDVVHDVTLSAGVPTFAQGELVWQSTQSLGDELSFNWRRDDTNDDYVDTEGPSPLMLNANQTLFEENEVGAGQPLRTVIFTGHNPTTEPPCAPPAPCTWGVGLQLSQRFTMYVHIFYNFMPPEGWRFTVDGDPVVPG